MCNTEEMLEELKLLLAFTGAADYETLRRAMERERRSQEPAQASQQVAQKA